MTGSSRATVEAEAARQAVLDVDASETEKAEMLMEIAMGLQQKPKSPNDLIEAISLYEASIELCPADARLLEARVQSRLATAQMILPAEDYSPLEAAKQSIEGSLKVLRDLGEPAEIAEAEMNYGLILQNLAGANRARIQDAISAYQRSLRTFDAQAYPAEFAVLQNNLATAFLSIPFTGDESKMREALAVQAFEEGLKIVNLVDHPSEYAMLQNNLGNALQYVSSSHRVENGFRALEAYDEALRVRNAKDSPGEYANTLANKANCLSNLPDDPADPDKGNTDNLRAAIGLYSEACAIFGSTGDLQKAETVRAAIDSLEAELSR